MQHFTNLQETGINTINEMRKLITNKIQHLHKITYTIGVVVLCLFTNIAWMFTWKYFFSKLSFIREFLEGSATPKREQQSRLTSNVTGKENLSKGEGSLEKTASLRKTSLHQRTVN